MTKLLRRVGVTKLLWAVHSGSVGDLRVADLTAPEGFPGSVTLFGADPEQHYR
jgi:hypothetical protein